MKDYLLNVMQQKKHGLYMCELPTGNGKTFDSARAMKEYADSIEDGTKIIYITTLNKNLPEDALRAAYGNEELYKQSVLRLRSNFDEVVEKLLDNEVPEGMQTEVYLKLRKDVSLYRNAIEKRYADKEYVKELEDRITEGDRQLRYEITKRLKNGFSTKTQRKNAIRNDIKYRWIGKLYPAVFTDDYKILLMSVSKFMKRNSILIDTSYEFLNSDLIENAVIVIDEFDATKDTIQSELIEKSLAMKEDYIQLFRQIYRTLNPNDFSSDMRQAMNQVESSGNRNTFISLMDEAKKIAENYHVRLSIKTREDLVDQRQIFLFNDGSFHTVLREGAQYIRSTLNEEDNRIDVFFEGKDDFFKNRNKEKDIVLYSLLRDINLFLLHFRLFTIEWARNYMDIVNSSRNGIMDVMNLENAISSVLKRLELTNRQRDLLMGETCQMVRSNHELILEDRSFYQVGMEYYEFEDNDSHHDNTNLKFVKVYDTPEKIMLYLAGKATVFGISATAEMDTVVGNYDLRYLKEQLKERFHKTPSYLKEKTRTALEKRWGAYTDGEIKVHGEIISSDIQGFNAEDYCKTFIDEEFARYCANIITNITDDEYQIIRYCNILKAMCNFNRNKDIHSMLYLGMALPKKNNPSMDEDVLLQLFEYSQLTVQQKNSSVFGNDKVAFRNSKRAKIKGNSDEFAIYEMSEKESGLHAILKYPGMRTYFEEKGYALEFQENEYLMSPVLFHNIYKGALGEVAGKFILSRELGIELTTITEPEYFEFFDYKLSDDVYVDFKNWKFTYVQDRDEIRKDILRKLDAIEAKRVYVINVVSDKNYKPSACVDQRLVEIPKLINEDGTVCYENLHMIHKEDFEYANE